ncbi:MAG: hypothetical protein ACR2QK_05680 [Acidimicrobiales bacterium]
MSTRSKNMDAGRRSHDRSALIQWVALGLLAALGLIAAFVLADGGGGGGGHSGAPAVSQNY